MDEHKLNLKRWYLGHHGTDIPPEAEFNLAKRYGQLRDLPNGTPVHANQYAALEKLADNIEDFPFNLARKPIDVEYGHVTGLLFQETHFITDERLKPLEKFPHIRSLFFSGINILEQDLQIIGSLSSLRSLTLHDACLDMSSLKNLSTLNGLMYLNLDSNYLEGASLSPFYDLKNLKTLSIMHTYIDGQEISRLEEKISRLRIMD